MSTHVEEIQTHGPGIPTFAKIWVALLVLTGARSLAWPTNRCLC